MSGYGTLPADRRGISRFLTQHFDRALLRSVPGLFDRADGLVGIAAPSGLLVAIRSVEGCVVALQCRVTDDSGKKQYLWLSSKSHEGPSAGSPAHVVHGEDSRLIYVTEGAKKAHLCSIFTGCTTIGMAGHANHTDALAALAELQRRGALAVVIAVDQDSDATTAAAVERSRNQLVEACWHLGLAVKIAYWDGETAKGIDDLYVVGEEPLLTTIKAEPEPGDPGERDEQRKLTQLEEAARYRQLRRLYFTSMPPTEKLALWASWEASDLYPGTIAAGGSVEPRAVNIAYMAKRIGVSRGVAGRAVEHLGAVNLLDYQRVRDPLTQHTTVKVAPKRTPAYNEELPRSEYKKRDAASKHCRSCGSTQGAWVWRCEHCGSIDAAGPCSDSEHGQDRVNPGSESEPLILSIGEKIPGSESEHGVVEETGVNVADPNPPTVAEIMSAADSVGVHIHLSDTYPLTLLVGPADRVVEPLARAIRQHRTALIDALYEHRSDDLDWWLPAGWQAGAGGEVRQPCEGVAPAPAEAD